MINPSKPYTTADYLEILRRRIWYIIIPFVLIASGTVVYTVYAPRYYRASTLVLVTPQRVPESFVQPTVTAGIGERLHSIAQEVMSRTRLEQIISEMNLYQEERKTLTPEQVVAMMQRSIKIDLPTRRDEGRGHFVITYTGRDPQVVATVANRLTSLFIEENLKVREQQAVGTTEFMFIELEATKKKLEQLETEVSDYKMRHMGELPEQMSANIRIFEQLQNQYQRLGDSLRTAQDRRLLIEKQLDEKQRIAATSPSGSIDQNQSQRDALERLLEGLKMRYTENHPDVIAARRKLAELEIPRATPVETYDPQIAILQSNLEWIEREIRRYRDSERDLIAQIEQYRSRIEQTPLREQEMASLLREYNTTRESYDRLLRKAQDAQQAESLERRQKGEQFRLIDPARVPQAPFSPDIQKILLLGFLAGIGGGFGLGFMREQLDRSFHDSGDLEATLDLKVLATIPKIDDDAA